MYMAVYAIGDIHGCYQSLQALLIEIAFDPKQDEIWLTGDLINRGPYPLEVLRYLMQLPASSLKVVLGNHDLHVLAQLSGRVKKGENKTCHALYHAADREALVDWLRQQPLYYFDTEIGVSMVHAGLPPQWTIQQAQSYSDEVSAVLTGQDWREFMPHLYGDKPTRLTASVKGWDKLRYIVNCFTRLRYCLVDGQIALAHKAHPNEVAAIYQPWFQAANRQSAADKIVFGHWSSLGTGQYNHCYSLDGGAVWGEKLTALRIDTSPFTWFSVPAQEKINE